MGMSAQKIDNAPDRRSKKEKPGPGQCSVIEALLRPVDDAALNSEPDRGGIIPGGQPPLETGPAQSEGKGSANQSASDYGDVRVRIENCHSILSTAGAIF